MFTLGSVICGFILDALLGDPRGLPHPVCMLGKLIDFLDSRLRRVFSFSHGGLVCGGALLFLIVAVLSFTVPFVILYCADRINIWLAFALETFMCYQIFAARSLRDESMKVYDALQRGDLQDARLKLSWIVGRDTEALSDEEVIKGAVETVAENTADGIIAPMLFMFLGGAPLAFLYKGINTMDSMIGYKNDKYLYFGRIAAKADDLANLVPARISGLAMIIAAYFLNLNSRAAWKIFLRDRYNHLSPNSAMTESAAAGALGIQLGGDHFYFGKLVHKDTIGDAVRSASAEDIRLANNLMYVTTVLCLTFFSTIRLIFLLEIS